jgi:hypothetical protein
MRGTERGVIGLISNDRVVSTRRYIIIITIGETLGGITQKNTGVILDKYTIWQIMPSSVYFIM